MPGPLKRRKTLGLNTRFDRMLAQVHVTHSYSSDPTTHRKRARSSGSSSVSSYDLPKTPVDAYSHEGRLGRDFSVLKMNKRPLKSPIVQRELKAYRKGSRGQAPAKALPLWLASTFSVLEPEHPLRELLPPFAIHEDEMAARTRNDSPRPCSQEASTDRMFAFLPFDADAPENDDTSHQKSRLPSADCTFCDDGLLPCEPTTVNAEIHAFHFGEDTPGFRPFSTPGSLAVLQYSGVSNAPPILDRLSELKQISAHINTPLLSSDASVNHAKFTSPSVIRRTTPESETFLSSLRRRSSIAFSALAPNTLTSDLQENELTMNIFSTPGPAFTVSRPVYFDSPTEDPSLSDPLEPESYELDLDGLDFHWQPFFRKTLPDPSLTNQQTPNIRASAAFPPVFEEPDGPLPDLPHSFRSVADEQATINEAPDVRIECGLLEGSFRGSPVSGHVIQQSPSPQLNDQSGTGVFAPASGIFISPLRGAPSSPAVPGMADVEKEQVKTQEPMLSADRITPCIPESHEQPFTPPRPTQASQPATPKKERSSQTRSTQHPPRQEQRSTVSWMLSRRSLSGRGGVGLEEIEGLFSQHSDTSHDTIESWTDHH
ncbi:uncharacterized protein EDB91DRAFT_611079 [Suillus paluster]|uniref:uncharacterized protein n=1 Tax=Suillus paluster TaxID=48578 RepID=UPI001B87DA6E|nr:uncharacterized protein EDB91DRAFT_611079 [Suillus paluster]KAG1751512.1 hypothetical protein EDB91DRAFT_611079 [Suillus paluster]